MRILEALDAESLCATGCLFGGGTRVALAYGEFRESADVDFLVSDPAGYAALRSRAREQGAAALFRDPGAVHLPRPPSTDQYGIRFPVEVDGRLVKVELVREGRIPLDGGVRPEWSPVDCLALDDMVAEKLLANSDRWLDRGVLSRDLIDLAVLRAREGPLPARAWQKASAAYGPSVRSDLRRAAAAFRGEDASLWRTRCFEGLAIEDPAPVLSGVAALLADLA
jgi:hypothetical protein